MDPEKYGQFKTDRNLTYNYYLSRGTSQATTLLFCHGFPSTSTDWQKQVLFFEEKGFGCLVPDMLGYGGTDKPTDPSFYGMKELAADMIQLVATKELRNVVAIGHDWGSLLVSRIANVLEGKESPFIGYAFLSASYLPPDPDFDYDTAMEFYEKTFGYGVIGYWKFFSWDGDAAKVVNDHAGDFFDCNNAFLTSNQLDSFYSLLFPKDSALWKSNWCPETKLKDWCLADTKTEPPTYMTKEEIIRLQSNILKGGFEAPFCWYKQFMYKITPKEDKNFTPNQYIIQKPVFFGAADLDCVCLPEIGEQIIEKCCPNGKVYHYNTDHWIIFAAPNQLNKDLLGWIGTIHSN